MNVSGLSFYPVNINFMTFAESMQDIICHHGHTMLALMAVEFMHMMVEDYVENKILAMLTRLNNVHHMIGEVFNVWRKQLLEKFSVMPRNKYLCDCI